MNCARIIEEGEEAMYGLPIVIFFGAIVLYIFWPWPLVLWYGIEYKVPHDKIIIEPRPTGCDFLHSPIGIKGCTYEKVVEVVAAEQGKYVFVSWQRHDD
jgi:hypothetical protein